MNFLVVGLSRRCGIVMKRTPNPPTVLLAISAGVSTTPAGTSGFVEFDRSLKSPFRSRWPGNLRVEENLSGVRFHLRSYEPRKNVFLVPGIGPLSDPPSSFRL